MSKEEDLKYLETEYEENIITELIKKVESLHNKLQQKENIIKKVREYIEEWQNFPHTNGSTHKELANIIGILDKGE